MAQWQERRHRSLIVAVAVGTFARPAGCPPFCLFFALPYHTQALRNRDYLFPFHIRTFPAEASKEPASFARPLLHQRRVSLRFLGHTTQRKTAANARVIIDPEMNGGNFCLSWMAYKKQGLIVTEGRRHFSIAIMCLSIYTYTCLFGVPKIWGLLGVGLCRNIFFTTQFCKLGEELIWNICEFPRKVMKFNSFRPMTLYFATFSNIF